MNVKKWMAGLAIACVLWSGATLAQAQGDDPIRVACNSTSAGLSGTVTVAACHSNPATAMLSAVLGVKSVLLSTVACDRCPNSFFSCPKTVAHGDIQVGDPVFNPELNLWCTAATYSGPFTVMCGVCPVK